MFVLDASITLAWLFEDEATPQTDAILARLETVRAIVPALWPEEVANALLAGLRRKRITLEKLDEAIAFIQDIPLEVMDVLPAAVFGDILPLAREENLTVYDATYLHLAARLRIPLATLDSALREAARRQTVTVLPERL